MKSSLIAAIAAAGMFVRGGDLRLHDQNTVVVYLENGAAQLRNLSLATKLAAKMFDTAGVRIVWRLGEPSSTELQRDRPIVVRISAGTPAAERPGALAYAFPYQGVRINIFYDRIVAAHPHSSYVILAHVLVHEATHLLEGVSRHSDLGVMKANWTLKDYDRMVHHPLPFSADDIDLIHIGLATRTSRLTPYLAEFSTPSRFNTEEVHK